MQFEPEDMTEGRINGSTRSKTWIAALVLGAIAAGAPGALLAQDRGINQPGAAGNRGGVRR